MPTTSVKPANDAITALPGIKGVTETVFFRETAVPRSPCEAQKDPRVTPRLTRPQSWDWQAQLMVFAPTMGADLLAIAKVICPHDWLDDSVYQSVVLAMDRDEGYARGLVVAYEDLPKGFESAPASLSEDELSSSLRKIETTSFFRSFLGMTIHYLYDDPEVWAGCGYEGVAGCKPGQPRDDIADVEWLPDPQIGEGQD